MTGRLAYCLLVSLAACQGAADRDNPQTFAEDSVAFVPPKGWEIKRDRDTLLLVGGSPKSTTRPTIGIRAVSVSGWTEERTQDNVLPNTEKVLRALPNAEITGPFDVEHPIYPAKAFDVTWTPRSRQGQRYQRRHITLVATDHLYHVFLTAPEGEINKSRPDFERVIESLREDG